MNWQKINKMFNGLKPQIKLKRLRSMTALRQTALVTVTLLILFLVAGNVAAWLINHELHQRIDNKLVLLHQVWSDVLGRSDVRPDTLNYVANDERFASFRSADGKVHGHNPWIGNNSNRLFQADGHDNFRGATLPDYKTNGWRILSKKINGGTLVVALSREHIHDVEDLIGQIFFFISSAVIVITLLIGLLIGLFHQRRINQINQALDQIASGDFNVKIKPPILRDDLDRVAAKIDATSARIEVLLQQMKNLSVNIAHDLKTPLARMRARLESALLEKNGNVQGEVLESLLLQTDQMINTFEAILRIACIDSGERKAHFKSLSVKELAEETAEIYAAVIEDAGHQFSIEIEGDVTILGDRELLIQLMANLLENAIRHTPPNSQIRLLVDGSCITVIDHGSGIPLDQRDRVLEPMYRLDQSRHTKGNGLGLALVKAIADLHDAKLELDYAFHQDDEKKSYGLKVSLIFPS